ncbi:Protein PELPK1 [Gryllus bimaculatus]|nr:Protein PELPK1 [Gryllus bimaculatus]
MDRVTLVVGSCGNVEGQKVQQQQPNFLILPTTSFILIQGLNKPPEPPTSILIVPVEDKNDPPLVANKFEMGNEEGQSIENGGNEESFTGGVGVAADAATQTNNRSDLGAEALVCPVCLQTSSSLSDLQAHTLTHSVENLYICEECGESFIEKNDFTNHKLVHTKRPERSPLLEEANLELPSLPDVADLELPSLPEDADLELPSLPEDADLDLPSLPENGDLELSSLPENADLELSSLSENADLELSSLPEDADFELSSLPEDADFEWSSLPEDADFELSSLPDDTDFELSSLSNENDMKPPSFPERCLISTLIEERDPENCDDPSPINEDCSSNRGFLVEDEESWLYTLCLGARTPQSYTYCAPHCSMSRTAGLMVFILVTRCL